MGAVVQADSEDEWLRCYRKMNTDYRIDLIGLSILSIPHCFGGSITDSRIKLLKILKDERSPKKAHLLGLGDSMKDVLFAQENCPFVVSNDSSCAFQSGLFEKQLSEDLEVPGGKVKEKVDFDLKEITLEQEKLIQSNIDIIRKKIKQYVPN